MSCYPPRLKLNLEDIKSECVVQIEFAGLEFYKENIIPVYLLNSVVCRAKNEDVIDSQDEESGISSNEETDSSEHLEEVEVILNNRHGEMDFIVCLLHFEPTVIIKGATTISCFEHHGAKTKNQNPQDNRPAQYRRPGSACYHSQQ